METTNDFSLETIEKWLNDSDCQIRVAAMNACEGKDVPLEFIEKGLNDVDYDVRVAAWNVLNEGL